MFITITQAMAVIEAVVITAVGCLRWMLFFQSTVETQLALGKLI
jgi:hypothetical protein